MHGPSQGLDMRPVRSLRALPDAVPVQSRANRVRLVSEAVSIGAGATMTLPSNDSIAEPLPGDLKRCKECGVEHFVARCGIDREAWNVAMWNLGEQKLRA